MSRVFPSQIVRLLDRTLSDVQPTIPGRPPALAEAQAPVISAVIDLISDLPQEFMVLSGDDYSNYRVSISIVSDLLYRLKERHPWNDRHMAEGAKHLDNIRLLLSKS